MDINFASDILLFKFGAYRTKDMSKVRPGEQEYSVYKGVPITELDEFRMAWNNVNTSGRIRVRFRGPRAKVGRPQPAARSICLKKDAETFAVYRR